MTLMQDRLHRIQDWGERLLIGLFLRKYYAFPTVDLEVADFECDGLILDIGGGGEGVIGRLKGSQVVAIDLHPEELMSIVEGPQKMVMDARDLKFPDDHFAVVTAFFSMMYMKTRADQQKVLSEAYRVLRPSGRMLIWDIDLPCLPETSKSGYLVRLHYHVCNYGKKTAYGAKWPTESRGITDYIQMAGDEGFHHQATRCMGHTFQLDFFKQVLLFE